jgi:hypothetical protein
MKQNETLFRLSQVTKRLDHMVPDPEISKALNSRASKGLTDLSKKLDALIPDPSLSPDEKLERLARVVQDRVPFFEYLQPANTKLHKLSSRLNELVPGTGSASAKVDKLVTILNKLVKQPKLTVVQKLEILGDLRAGIDPVS